MHSSRTWPGITLAILGLSGLGWWLPGLAGMLALERPGGWWGQLWTGHLVHWTGSHFLWNALAFAVLGSIAERHWGKGYLPWLVVSAPIIAGINFAGSPDIGVYRGLSGINTFLFVALWMDLIRDRERSQAIRLGSFLAGGGLLLKLIYEVSAGDPFFSGSLGPGVVVAPWAHLGGILVGLGFHLWASAGKSKFLSVCP